MLASRWRFDRGCPGLRREERGKIALTCGRTRERDPAPESFGDLIFFDPPPGGFAVPEGSGSLRGGQRPASPQGGLRPQRQTRTPAR
jgi:hypothetical protein